MRVGEEEPRAARKVVVVVGEGEGVGMGMACEEEAGAVTPVVDGVFEGVAPRERVGLGLGVGEEVRLSVLVVLGLAPWESELVGVMVGEPVSVAEDVVLGLAPIERVGVGVEEALGEGNNGVLVVEGLEAGTPKDDRVGVGVVVGVLAMVGVGEELELAP